MIFASLIAGICCKLYDDLNDMDLFDTFGIDWISKNKLYINEFLKGMHFTLFGMIISKCPIFAFGILILNSPLFIFNTKAFDTYEFSGFMVVCILCGYFIISNSTKLNTLHFSRILFEVLIYFMTMTIVELPFMNIESNYTKLFQRILCVICVTIHILVSSSCDNCHMIPCLYYCLGYLIVSCLFQYYYLVHIKNKNTFNNLEQINHNQNIEKSTDNELIDEKSTDNELIDEKLIDDDSMA